MASFDVQSFALVELSGIWQTAGKLVACHYRNNRVAGTCELQSYILIFVVEPSRFIVLKGSSSCGNHRLLRADCSSRHGVNSKGT